MNTATVERLLADFADMDSWEDRYRYIVELGDEMTEMPAELKTEENRVQGCVSNVWLAMDVRPGDLPVLRFVGDSDSMVIRGLISILLMLCSGLAADEVARLDFEPVFERLELSKHLSASRNNGLRSLVSRIRALARHHV